MDVKLGALDLRKLDVSLHFKVTLLDAEGFHNSRFSSSYYNS